MALTAKSFGTVNQNLPSGHMPSGGRNVASVARAPIEEVGARSGVQAEESFIFQNFTEQGFRKKQSPEQIKNTASLFEAQSSSFAHLLGQDQFDREKSKTPQYGTANLRHDRGLRCSSFC